MNAKDEMNCMLEQQEFYARRQAQLDSIYEKEKSKFSGDNNLIEEILELHDRIDELEEKIDQLELGSCVSNKKRSPFIQIYQGGDKPECNYTFTLTDVQFNALMTLVDRNM